MKVLIVGGGGREHALAWKVRQSSRVSAVYCAPGNAGTCQIAENVPIPADDIQGLADFAMTNKVALTIVGPEVPLCAGIADLFTENNLRVFGPSQRAAQIEGSKSFAKKLMEKYGIPTASFKVFNHSPNALNEIDSRWDIPVIKADGLAAGKGVFVPETKADAKQAVLDMMEGKIFNEAGNTVVLEKKLYGQEASILAITDGTTILPLESSQDHKPALDNDEGPNTGGMGAYSPAPIVTKEVMSEVQEKVLNPLIKGLRADGIEYKGVVYAGIMITRDGPMVLEFNARFGDPETQAILPRLRTDLVELTEAVIDGRLSQLAPLTWDPRACVSVVLAAGGYPERYEKGKVIEGLDRLMGNPNIVVFHAGTKMENGRVVTSGGRVLGVSALGVDIAAAIENAYGAADQIQFEGKYCRRDIGKKALVRA